MSVNGSIPRVTQQRLREVLSYDPVTGYFTWRVSTSNRVKVGQRAGTIDAHGYENIKVDGRIYKSAHLAWLYAYGRWPATGELDHVEAGSTKNALTNLRDATRSQNNMNRRVQSNNTSGFKGVSFHTQRQRWAAYIKVNGKRKHLGLFDTPELASAAYEAAARVLHHEFAKV